jgi:hypothetical protein
MRPTAIPAVLSNVMLVLPFVTFVMFALTRVVKKDFSAVCQSQSRV